MAKTNVLKCQTDTLFLSKTFQWLPTDLRIVSSVLSSPMVSPLQTSRSAAMLWPWSHRSLSHLLPAAVSCPGTQSLLPTPPPWQTPLYRLGLALDVTFFREPSWSLKRALECTFLPIIILSISICTFLLTCLCLTTQGRFCGSKHSLSFVRAHSAPTSVWLIV